MLVSIIIKCLNEEAHIATCIESALRAAHELDGNLEVIVADSASTDNTLKIAQRYPIKIVSLVNPEEKSCGIGAELGYRISSGKYIYVLDGDMVLCEGFIKKGIEELEKRPDLGGVAGLVEEMVLSNFAMVGRKYKADTSTPNDNAICLNMGGLYKRIAVESVGYFTNRNLHSFEEFELGIRLKNKGWRLSRIDVPSVKHYGPHCSSATLLWRRWKTGYASGNGELFRSSLSQPYFYQVVINLKIFRTQFFSLLVWFFSALLPFLAFADGLVPFFVPLLVWFVIFIGLSLIKKSIFHAIYSICAWHLGIIGFFRGAIAKPRKQPTDVILFNKIK